MSTSTVAAKGYGYGDWRGSERWVAHDELDGLLARYRAMRGTKVKVKVEGDEGVEAQEGDGAGGDGDV